MDRTKNQDAQIITFNPELRNLGFADGQNIGGPLSEAGKNKMIKKAAKKIW